MGKYDSLKWKTLSEEVLLHTPVMNLIKQHKQAANGLEGDYMALGVYDWIIVVPVIDGKFALVRQWRHGEERLTLEFPGGCIEPGEDPAVAAARELEEETGYRAGKLTCLGRVSSNPAIMQNHFSIFLAEDMVQTGSQHLDKDEFIMVEEYPIAEVIERFGDEEMTHAFMGTALAMYMRHCRKNGIEIDY